MATKEAQFNFLLPFHGELHLAKNKIFKETIVLVPFYGAKPSSLSRHCEFLNELGYDVASFRLKFTLKETRGSLFSSSAAPGFKHIWADQIEAVLNAISGDKILYAFSNPSASAIEALARRRAVDVTGLICDSGPSSEIFQSLVNYFSYEEPIRLMPLRWAAAFTARLAWSPSYKEEIASDMTKLPENFKILSIRGWKDPLISAQDIDKVFDPHSQIDWQRLSLPQAKHLNGLRDFPEEYIPPVELFLKSISTMIKD